MLSLRLDVSCSIGEYAARGGEAAGRGRNRQRLSSGRMSVCLSVCIGRDFRILGQECVGHAPDEVCRDMRNRCLLSVLSPPPTMLA